MTKEEKNKMTTTLKIIGAIIGLIVLFLVIGRIDVFSEDFIPSCSGKIIISALIAIACMVYNFKSLTVKAVNDAFPL